VTRCTRRWLASLGVITFIPGIAWCAPPDAPTAGNAPMISSEQLVSDWVRQAIVRNMPPSIAQCSTSQDASGGCDGVIQGRYGFHTAHDDKPWWQVDLQQVTTLSRIDIYNRCDGGSDRASRIQVLLSTDGETWKQIYQHDGSTFFGFTDKAPLSIRVDKVPARFVRIQAPGRQYLHLEEVEVYAVGNEVNLALHKPADQSSVSRWSIGIQTHTLDDSPSNGYPVEQVLLRGLRLAENIQDLGGDVASPLATLAKVRQQLEQLPDQELQTQQRELYLQSQRAIRELTLSNPLLNFDDLLLVKRVPGTFTHMSDQYYGWFSRPGGGLFVLEGFKTATPQLRELTAALPSGSILRPDISHDAQRVLFAHCKYYPGLADEANKLDKANVPEDAFYHLYEMNLDGTGLRRLTSGKYDDFDGRYLPDGRIVFLSTRRGQDVKCTSDDDIAQAADAAPDCYVRCGGGPERPVAVYTLHLMDPNGERIARISPFEMFEWTPSVDAQGQVLYARWDYVDRHNMPYMSLWSTMPDGTDARAVYGNYTLNPHCIFEARRIPDSRKIVFTASGHHAMTGGSLVLIDPNRGADGEEPLTRLTPEVVFPEAEGWPPSYFANPYPLSENHYLVAWSSSELPPGTPRPDWGMPGPVNDLGVYLFDAFGNLSLIYRDPAISSMYPLPIRRRPRPPRITSRVDNQAEDDKARMLVVDVYRGLESIPTGTIKQLRLVGIPAKTHPTMNSPEIGVTRDDPGKFVIGTVPVEPDGSAYFHAPPGVPFFLQALDDEGMAVQTMRSATYLQPGQAATCIGCHEPRNTAPPNRLVAAAKRPPSKIAPSVEGSWPLDYQTLVQPVLDKHCVSCHGEGEQGNPPDLTRDHSYGSLVDYGAPSLREHVLLRYQQGRSTVGACTARMNQLWTLLDGGHYQVQLDRQDRARLIIWMDTYGQKSGSFDQHQIERLKSLRAESTSMLEQ
jgi:hypothetical protein